MADGFIDPSTKGGAYTSGNLKPVRWQIIINERGTYKTIKAGSEIPPGHDKVGGTFKTKKSANSKIKNLKATQPGSIAQPKFADLGSGPGGERTTWEKIKGHPVSKAAGKLGRGAGRALGVAGGVGFTLGEGLYGKDDLTDETLLTNFKAAWEEMGQNLPKKYKRPVPKFKPGDSSRLLKERLGSYKRYAIRHAPKDVAESAKDTAGKFTRNIDASAKNIQSTLSQEKKGIKQKRADKLKEHTDAWRNTFASSNPTGSSGETPEGMDEYKPRQIYKRRKATTEADPLPKDTTKRGRGTSSGRGVPAKVGEPVERQGWSPAPAPKTSVATGSSGETPEGMPKYTKPRADLKNKPPKVSPIPVKKTVDTTDELRGDKVRTNVANKIPPKTARIAAKKAPPSPVKKTVDTTDDLRGNKVRTNFANKIPPNLPKPKTKPPSTKGITVENLPPLKPLSEKTQIGMDIADAITKSRKNTQNGKVDEGLKKAVMRKAEKRGRSETFSGSDPSIERSPSGKAKRYGKSWLGARPQDEAEWERMREENQGARKGGKITKKKATRKQAAPKKSSTSHRSRPKNPTLQKTSYNY